jgi:hypothetical protein
MAEVVRPKIETRYLEGRLPHPPAEVASAQRFPVRGSEDQRIVGGSDVACQMLGQLIPEETRDHNSPTLVGLRRAE